MATAWLVACGRASAVVRFPREAEPGEWWAGRLWMVTPWVSGGGLVGIKVVFGDAGFTAIAYPRHGERLTSVEEVHDLLNTEPVVGFTTRPSNGSKAEPWRFRMRP
jgi:hypothetical protein